MGLRGPRGRPDELARLLGYPSHRRRTLEPRLATEAEVMATASADSPLGWLNRSVPPEPESGRRRRTRAPKTPAR
jgi:hypothetical protein